VRVIYLFIMKIILRVQW